MYKALDTIVGDRVNLREFVERYGADPKQWLAKPQCPGCGRGLHAYDPKGAVGFRDVEREITTLVQRRPGFHHYKHGAGDNCRYSYANDPRYADIPSHKELHQKEIVRNVAAIQKPITRNAVERVAEFFIHGITGSSVISPADRKSIDHITRTQLLQLKGLSAHAWLLPYMQVLLMGPKPQTFVKNSNRVVYQKVGLQRLNYVNANGEASLLTAPFAIRLCWSSEKGHVWPMKNGRRNVTFPVSRAFALNIAKPPERRAAKIKPPTPRKPRKNRKFDPNQITMDV